MFLRFLIPFGVVVTTVLAEAKEECLQLYSHEVLDCCKTKPQTEDDYDNQPTNKNINKMGTDVGQDGKYNSSYTGMYDCDFEINGAKLRGLTTADDGTFDEKAVENFINEHLTNMPELAGVIVKDCVNGDLTNYGPPELKCDLIRLGNCAQVHYLSTCNEWEKSEYCIKTEELVKTCLG
ncbi:hypothetical protein O0L34_g11582 [Tuta absoluta]|nr:hypothetical protein O0L34_g11582 [Tuta absoluta]